MYEEKNSDSSAMEDITKSIKLYNELIYEAGVAINEKYGDEKGLEIATEAGYSKSY